MDFIWIKEVHSGTGSKPIIKGNINNLQNSVKLLLIPVRLSLNFNSKIWVSNWKHEGIGFIR